MPAYALRPLNGFRQPFDNVSCPPMVFAIEPWSAYEGRLHASSAHRMPIEAAFADVVLARTEFPAAELRDIFAAPADEGENDAARDLVRIQAERLADRFVSGAIATYARPVGGGIVTVLAPELWEIDDPLPRFATGALNLEHWADPSAPPTHRILVDREQFNRWFAALPAGTMLTDRQVRSVVDPQARATRSAANAQSTQVTAPLTSQAVPSERQEPAGVGPRYLTQREVSEMTSLARSTIYEKIRSSGFPQQVVLGGEGGSVRWIQAEVEQWLAEQAAKRGG